MEIGYGLTGWRSKLCLALLLFIHAFGATAEDDHGVTFLFPNTTTQSDLTLYYMDTVNVSYISPFPSPNLYTFCNSGKTFIRVQDAAPFNGSTFVLLNFTSTTPCYFNLRPGTEAGHGRNSDKFTLSPNQRSQTTVGLPQSSATSTSTVSTTSATSSASGSVTSTPSSVPNSSGSSGLSAGAKAGIGIGVALGVIALVCVAGFLVLRRRKRQGGIGVTGTTYEKGDNDVSANNPGAAAGLQPSQHSGASPYSEVEGSKYWQQPPPPSELNAMTSPQEMGVQRGRHELPG